MTQRGAPPAAHEARAEPRSLRATSARVLLGMLAALPDRAGLALGAALGRAWARLGLPRTRVARVNLRIAFPGWSEAERWAVLVRSFENLGRSLVELAWMGRRPAALLAARVRIDGLEHFEAARASAPGGGVIILSAHFGSWEMFAAAMSAHGYPLTIVHRPRDDARFDEVLLARRLEGGATYLPRGNAALGVVRALRRGGLLALLLDQNTKRADGVFVSFFGRLACVRSGPVQLAMSTRAPVVPAFLHRDRDDPSRHVVRVRPALELAEGPDEGTALRENARRMTAAIEDEIRGAPELWTWAHRRWRTQPGGEPPPPYRLPRTIH